MWNPTFKPPKGYPLPNRRSPEPPRAFVEPLSPTKPKPIEPNFNYPALDNTLNFTVKPQNTFNNTSKARAYSVGQQTTQKRGHYRTPSTIDTLAEAALSFASPAPRKSSVVERQQTSGHSHAHPAYHPHGGNSEPPHKRHRSDFLPSSVVAQYASRPATSYDGHSWNANHQNIPSYDRRVEEAALLLNFSTTGGWPSTSPNLYPAAPSLPRPHANSFPQDVHYQRLIEHVPHATLLPPFNPRVATNLPPPTLPSPQQTSEGTNASPKAVSEKVSEDVAMTDAPPEVLTVPAMGMAPPQQTQTPPDEPMSRAPSTDVGMSESSDAPRKRGWPKGKPRGNAVRKAVTEKAASKRAAGRKKAQDASKGRSGLDEVAAELREGQQESRRNSFNGVTGSPEHFTQERSQSVPREVPMIVREGSLPKQGRKKIAKETICAGCQTSRDSNTLGDLDEWISCNGCNKWYHLDCAGFKKAYEVRDVDKYFCDACEPTHGKTTYVRKSQRAHTSVDYAELQKGVLKTSEDSTEHHYIQPIKDGTFTFDPESFPRMRPELVTRDFLEKSGAFVEPICIPAEWNPRPWEKRQRKRTEDGAQCEGGDADLKMDDLMLNDDNEYDMVPDDGQDELDMVMPENLTVRQVCNLVGPEMPLDVIDVKTQNSGAKMNLGKWADYYEEASDDKPIKNVISLEVSQTKLGRLLRRPKVVRDIDLQDAVWPKEETEKGKFPKVQFYCLMSIADSYTDFHIDFGGSRVYYHILRGKKTFFFIPPKPKHLKAYEEWNDSPQQNFTFLPHTTKECYRVDLSEGDTMLIPSGWIHAVWTPETSLVIGGNFLNRMSYKNQFRVVDIEKNNNTPQKFRYPHFQRIMWYTAIEYLKTDPLPQAVSQLFYEGKQFERSVPIWQDFDGEIAADDPRPGAQNTRYYSQAEMDGLPELVNFIFRTVMLVMGRIEGISADRIKRVNASIPKGHGEPLEVAKTFALWVAWKRGNEDPPNWAHPDAVLPKDDGATKKLSARALREMEKKEAIAAHRVVAPDRQSRRMIEKAARVDAASPAARSVSGAAQDDTKSYVNFTGSPSRRLHPSESSPPSARMHAPLHIHQTPSYASPQMFAHSPNGAALMMSSFSSAHISTPKTSVLGPKRVACDACRKRRIRCKHKDAVIQLPGSVHNSPDGLAPGFSVASDIGDNIAVSPYGNSNQQNAFYGSSPEAQQVNGSHGVSNGSATNGVNGESHPGGGQGPLPGTNAYINANIPMTMNGVPMFGEASKRGRSKACYECRKSKRRCIHDENGNVDPVKAAETPVPRGSVASKKRQGEDGSPPQDVKKPKNTPTPTPAPPPMQGLHGVLRPVNPQPQPPKQPKPSRTSSDWSNGASNGVSQFQPDLTAQPNGIQHHQQQPQNGQHDQHNHQQNASAPPIDPSLMAPMYPEPAGSNPYGGLAYPYPSHERPNLYNLPSLEQIATEVLDMDHDDNIDSGFAALQDFNRQREENVHVYQPEPDYKPEPDYTQEDGNEFLVNFTDEVGKPDGSVDSGVSLPASTEIMEHPSISVTASAPDGDTIHVASVQAPVDEIVFHHELPPAPTPSIEQPFVQPASPAAEAEAVANAAAEDTKPAVRRSSVADLPVYIPPPSRSPELARKILAAGSTSPSLTAKSPATPNRRGRNSFSFASSAKKGSQEPNLSALEEEDEDTRFARLLQQEELGLSKRGA